MIDSGSGEILALMMGFFAILGVALAALVLRADPRRLDNRIFAAMCAVDALTASLRAAHVLDGRSLTDVHVLRACLIGSIIIAYITIEFAYSFPFNRAMPRRRRWLIMSGSLLAIGAALHPATASWFAHNATVIYFLPCCLITLFYLKQNLRRLTGEDFIGIPLVMFSIALRWISAMGTFLVAKRLGPDTFAAALLFDATASIFLSYALLAYALLRYHLFRVRGVVADVILHGGGVVATVATLWLAVELALTQISGPMSQRVLLVSIALIPSGIIAVGKWLLPKIEERILCPIDPRRAAMKGVLEGVVHRTAGKVEPKEMLAVTLEAAVEINCGGKAVFVRGPAFPAGAGGDEATLGPALALHLATTRGDHLHRPFALGLGADVARDLEHVPGSIMVPVRRTGILFGAITLDGGLRDRDAVLTVVALADHLALKLENYDLFARMLRLQTELDETRRLAALGSFAAAIAHDLRTPLTSIQMNVQILRGKAKLPADDMEYFDIALEELKRLNAHISELLDYAKPVMVKKTPVDLGELADDALKGVEPILVDRHLRLEKTYTVVPPVLADATRIRQVVVNLLENAAQATAQGGAITLRTRADNGHIALDVADTGRGIDAENLGKIFEPFFTTRADGTGLGLAIAQKLVRAHGGEIRVRSTPGEGSTFTVLLPAS